MGITRFYTTVKYDGVIIADEMMGDFETREQCRQAAIEWALNSQNFRGILADAFIRRLDITIRPDLRGFILSESLDEMETYRESYPACSSCESEDGTCVGIFSEADESGIMLARFLCWKCLEIAQKAARNS